MPADIKQAYITFRAGTAGPRVYLGLDQLERRGGLEPDVWSAEVPYTALETLGLGDVEREVGGTVELWYADPPPSSDGGDAPLTTPDVTLGNCAIVDVVPAEWGIPLGETDPRAIVYRVAIADHRRAWVAPRGGLLLGGRLNPDPLPDGVSLVNNKTLMEQCAAAMGVTMTVPASVNDADPVREFDASFRHAPTALQELLEASGTVYAPLISGAAQVVKPGTAATPTIPDDRLISNVAAKSIDRRASKVIYTSQPAAEIHSWTSAASSPPAWKYVAQDPDADDRWRPLADISALGGDAAAAWTAGLSGVAEAKRGRLLEQMYRCIQLDPAKYPPGQVQLLPRYVDVALKETAIRLRVTDLLVRQQDGTYYAQVDNQWLVPEHVVPEANVLVFVHPLLKIPGSPTNKRRGRLGKSNVAIAESAIKPWFSVEGWDGDNSRKKLGTFGFKISGLAAVAMTEAESIDALTGYRPDTCILQSPDLQLVRVDGTSSDNRSTMSDRAKTYARNAMGVTTPQLREVRIKGFLAVELDAAVSEIVYDRRAVETRLTLNGWHCPPRTSGGSR